MVAYSFRSRFADPIRADRKRHARPGELVQIYTGMRTRSCRLIGTAECVAATPIALMFARAPIVTIGGRLLTFASELHAFARRDGFESRAAMDAFWRAEHGDFVVWRGVLIEWRDFAAPTGVSRHERPSNHPAER